MKDWKHTRTLILIYRIILCLLVWTTLILMFYDGASKYPAALDGFLRGLYAYRYYTMQTNLFVAIWLTLAIIFHFKPDKLAKIKGTIKGGLTIYIFITFVIFAIMLSDDYNPDKIISIFTNITSHYVIPILFFIDWMFTEKTVQYKWRNLGFWLIYPFLYLILSIVHGTITGKYLYPFLDIPTMGLGKYFLAIGILIIGYIALGSIFVLSNRFLYRKLNPLEEEPEMKSEN